MEFSAWTRWTIWLSKGSKEIPTSTDLHLKFWFRWVWFPPAMTFSTSSLVSIVVGDPPKVFPDVDSDTVASIHQLFRKTRWNGVVKSAQGICYRVCFGVDVLQQSELIQSNGLVERHFSCHYRQVRTFGFSFWNHVQCWNVISFHPDHGSQRKAW